MARHEPEALQERASSAFEFVTADRAGRELSTNTLMLVLEQKAQRSRLHARDRGVHAGQGERVANRPQAVVANVMPRRQDKLFSLNMHAMDPLQQMRVLHIGYLPRTTMAPMPLGPTAAKWTAYANAVKVLLELSGWHGRNEWFAIDGNYLPVTLAEPLDAVSADARPSTVTWPGNRGADTAPSPSWCADMAASLEAEMGDLHDDAANVAKSALADARRLAGTDQLPRPRAWNMSEGGLLSLEWNAYDVGVLIVLSGEGEASFSVKYSAKFYDAITDFRIDDGIGPEVRKALDDLLRR